MFRRSRSGSVAGRRALLVLLPLVAGVVVLQVTGERYPARTGLLERTQASVAPIAPDGAAGGAVGGEPVTSVVAPAVNEAPAAPTDSGGTPASTIGAPAPTTTAPASTLATTTSTTAPQPTTPPTTTTLPTTTVPAATVPATTTTATPARPARVTTAEAEVAPLTNRDRRANGLGAVTRDACLDGVASRYAEQLARSGILAHDPGAGPAVTGCRPGATWGDNIGTSAPCDTALLEDRWMASPGHRRNILTGAFALVGVGAWTDADGGCWVQVLFSS